MRVARSQILVAAAHTVLHALSLEHSITNGASEEYSLGDSLLHRSDSTLLLETPACMLETMSFQTAPDGDSVLIGTLGSIPHSLQEPS
eukprot:scaffold160104_cov20-Tisochrysis_lutea.AAC.1